MNHDTRNAVAAAIRATANATLCRIVAAYATRTGCGSGSALETVARYLPRMINAGQVTCAGAAYSLTR